MTIEKIRSYWESSEWRYPLVAFLLTWIILWAWMFLVVQTLYGGTITPDPLLRPYMGVTPEPNPVLSVWQRWDALHYQAIAEWGYDAFETAYYITPMYPLLMRGLGWLLGGNTLLAGILVSSLACLGSLSVLYELAKTELKDVQLARRALTYFVIFPSAFFLFAPYTESLFLLAALLALWFLRKEKWLAAGLCGAWAAMSRAPGMMMAIPAAWAAWVAWRRTKALRPWLAPFLTGLGVLVWPLYTWLVAGLSFMTPLEMGQERLHGWFTFPGAGIVTAVRNIWNDVFPVVNGYELFFTLLFLAGLVLVIKRLPGVYAVYCLAFMFLYVTRTNELYPLLGMSRYVLVLFPVFFVAAQLGENRWVNRAIVYGSLAGALFLSAQYAIWGWAG